MLCTNLKETKRMDNTEIIKVKVEQYYKTIVDNMEKSTKTGEVIERINKDTEDVDQYLSEDSNNCIVIQFNATEHNKRRLTNTTIQSSITSNNINYEQSKINNKTKSMVSLFVSSSLNNIVPRSLNNYRKKELIRNFERSKRNSNSKPVDSSYNSNIDAPKFTSTIFKSALDINTVLNTSIDNNSNKMIEKQELEYITNNIDPVAITTNEDSRSGLYNKKRMFSQNKINNTKIAKLSPFLPLSLPILPPKKMISVQILETYI